MKHYSINITYNRLGDEMIKRYVQNYIKHLKYEDMVCYIQKEGISLTEEEYQFLFTYIKKNWCLLFSNREQIFKDLKNSLSLTTYSKIEPILLSYQEKYKAYL